MSSSHGPNCFVESVVVVPPSDACIILQSDGLGCFTESGKLTQGHFPTFVERTSHDNETYFFFMEVE